MFPIALDLTRIPILLIGQGELLARRRTQLEEYGATQVRVVEAQSVDKDAIQTAYIVMIAGLPRERAEAIVSAAHAQGKLVNVEDINDLCDFYFTANIRRGDLVIAVSTSGASPTLARKIRDRIAGLFGEEWAAYVRELKELRLSLKTRGASMKEIIDHTEQHVRKKGWLAEDKDAA